jgi:hypothetical protein
MNHGDRGTRQLRSGVRGALVFLAISLSIHARPAPALPASPQGYILAGAPRVNSMAHAVSGEAKAPRPPDS